MKAKIVKQLTVYPMIDAVMPALPPRSRLYRLEPIGIGTPFTESLTSYMCRLAKAHRVTMGALFELILLPTLGNKYLIREVGKRSLGSSLRLGFGNYVKNVNGVCTTASRWVDVIESLTVRYDLRFLTLITLSDVLHQRHLLRTYQAWCPECYEESRLNNQVIYSPIIWFLSVVEKCPRHLRRLIERCPGCGQPSLPLACRTFPGYCARCTTWLGTEHKDESDLIPESQIQWHTFVSRNIGELIAAMPSLESTLTREGVARAFRICIGQFAEGMPKFGKILGKSKSTIWGWYHGTVRASLDEMLKICYCFDISLVAFLLGSEKQLSSLSVVRSLPDMYMSRPVRTVKRIDYSKVGAALRDLLCRDIPISMEEASVIVGVDVRSLYARFSEICYAISKRNAEYQRAVVEERRQRLKEEVTEACIRLRAQGLYPSKRRIAKHLGKPPYANRRDVTAIARNYR